MQDLHVAAYQMNIQNAKKEENLNNVQQVILENHRKEIDIWVLPEMFTTGFAYSHFTNLAEDLENSITLNKLQKISEDNSTNIAGSFLIKDSKKGTFHNLGFIISPTKGLIYPYYKIHLWGDEKNYFSPGLDLVEPVNINGKALVGLAICYDLRFPEVYRNLVLMGAEVLITSASWPMARIDHFNLLASARALENTVYHIAVNRLGADYEPTLTKYNGSTRILDPLGNVISGASNFEQVIFAHLKSENLEKARKIIPVLKDRMLVMEK